MSTKDQEVKEFTKVSGMIVYCKMYDPVKAFVKPGAPKKPDEWDCCVVMTDEDEVDALEAYGKSLDTMLSITKVKTVDFESKYKAEPPEGAGKNVWVFKLRKSTEQGKTGRKIALKWYPQVLMNTKEGRIRLNDIWEEVETSDAEGNTVIKVKKNGNTPTLVGNGSYGTMSIDRFDRTTGGATLSLKNLLVTKLVEYEGSSGAANDGSEFDDDNASDGAGGNVKVPAKAKFAEAKKTVAKPAPKPSFEDDDDSIPF